DYWGVSFKESINWLLTNEIVKEKQYKLAYCGSNNQFTYLLPSNIVLTDKLADADYYICFTRFNLYLQLDQKLIIHKVERDGVPLSLVYKLK
ncbi:MAG: hypothetical protein WCK31_01365, partial [bacterium]